MSPTHSKGKAARILAAVRRGVGTCADIEVELDFALTKHQIAGHLSNLKRAGRIRVSGVCWTPTARRAFRYEAVS